MSAHDKAAKARARMDQVRREMAERRALRTRNARAARERAAEALSKQGPVAEQVAKHMGELGRRRAQAGGWATESTERDKDYIMGFGGEDAEAKPEFVFRATRPREEPPPGGLGAIEDDTPAPAPEPPKPVQKPVQPPPPVRRPARPTEVLDDEDDFSNQSSWMNRQ
ncbi:hypothetical protein [Actinophytocola gossypii]|uniref:Uncharacterized protein n=1 Tax=Actinophytocola gossypii TaxID=2812003 RepID=A0ABT2JJG5_9PSEU|nr:hypothetical protein [Actinophytocola gossypii]MCT2587394.1 hypothetical protein [Actinophytocola gossypii]